MSELFSATDQASGLRRLFRKRATPVIAFVAQGGARLSDRARVMMQVVDDLLAAGRSVSLLDEYSQAGGIAHAYGASGHKDLKHALRGDFALDEVIFSPLPGLALIAAPRAAGMEFTLADEAALAGNLALLRNKSDYVLIDCAPRAARTLSPIAACADRLLVVVAGDGGDLTQAYGLIKRAAIEKHTLPIAVVIAQATDTQHARATYDKLHRVALDHLGIRLHYQGVALTPGAHQLSLRTEIDGAEERGERASRAA